MATTDAPAVPLVDFKWTDEQHARYLSGEHVGEIDAIGRVR